LGAIECPLSHHSLTPAQESGAPAAGVVVTGFQGVGDAALRRTDRTAADGTFTLRALADGDVRLYLQPTELIGEPRERMAGPHFAAVKLSGGRDAGGVELVLRRAPPPQPPGPSVMR
jgi:hypothetical protein